MPDAACSNLSLSSRADLKVRLYDNWEGLYDLKVRPTMIEKAAQRM
jgi:hypothetical protein